MPKPYLGLLALFVTSVMAFAGPVEDNIAAIKSVPPRGEQNVAAAKAASWLSQSATAEDLVPILAAMNDADPLAANWLRGAFESVTARTISDQKFPADQIEAFAKDTSNTPRVRRLAYEWLIKVDESAPKRFDLLNDPSPEMRRDAVAALIEQAEQADEDASRVIWQKAIVAAVDEDQVDTISKALKKLEIPFNYVDHFGLVVDWHVIGPFDNHEMKGFPVPYPPEKEVRLDATYEGQKGPVKWEPFHSEESDGAFDLAKLTEPHKGAVDYIYTEFNAGGAQDVEFRLGTANAWKLWVNDELVFAREEYHRGMRFDQYIVPGKLKAGKNTILIKVCQNEQDQDWAQRWAVQFRICNTEGRAVHPVE
ncbi:MAG: hypothetical protein H6824_12090 [Planctomycetaceae bacterium]|nr:hypothetical protein [Planctomycetaceae bacterium]